MSNFTTNWLNSSKGPRTFIASYGSIAKGATCFRCGKYAIIEETLSIMGGEPFTRKVGCCLTLWSDLKPFSKMYCSAHCLSEAGILFFASEKQVEDILEFFNV